MVRSYLRHGPTQAFGLICSSSSNSVYDGKLAYVPALEDVLVWDIKKGQMIAMWHEPGHRAEVTCIAKSPQVETFAVGYADGSIRLWNASSGSVIATFNGHRKAVTALAFDFQDARLASGSQDTDIIIWDIVAEAGLYRLRGHRDQITGIRFVEPQNLPSTSDSRAALLLLTTAKDTFIKVWDLSTQHCAQTVVAHRSEIWALELNPNKTALFTGGDEGELKAWRLDYEGMYNGLLKTDSGEIHKFIIPYSTMPLASQHRVSQILYHPSEPYLAVQSHDRSIEVFRVRTDTEVRKKQARRRKRTEEKQGKGSSELTDMDGTADQEEVKLVDRLAPHVIIRASGKIRSFDVGGGRGTQKGLVHFFVALASNALEIYGIPPLPKSRDDVPEPFRISTLDLPGHRTDVRTLCLSSDDQVLVSASNGTLKVWNIRTNACIRTIECGYAICSTFLPDDRHVVVGTKSGEILVFNVASSTLVETIKAHSSTIWSLHVRADGRSLVTGSADKEVKFWDITLVNFKDHGDTYSSLLLHTRTLKMSDDVLAVRYSPDSKLLAVALLDSTVKIFYQDTMKYFLSLYGHKLPVLAMDISHDAKLIVTCSADKNVKIWGLDFGDCHKSIFAHEESVMQVQFEKKSHYFWTVGKDKMLKYWDGDKFENIQRLEGHHSEIWAMAVSNHGNFVITGSHDKSIRVWEKLDEPLFLEEERERELEAIYDAKLAQSLDRYDAVEDNANARETAAVHKQTTGTLMAGERLMEALDLADAERVAFKEYEDEKAQLNVADSLGLQPPPRNPILAALDVSPEAYVLQIIEKIPSTALDDALLVLPFEKVTSLMVYLAVWSQEGLNVALTSRILFFLLKMHHHQIVANKRLRTTLIPLRLHLRTSLRREQENIRYNLSALQYIKRKSDADKTTQYYEGLVEEEVKAKINEGRKRKRVQLRA